MMKSARLDKENIIKVVRNLFRLEKNLKRKQLIWQFKVSFGVTI